MNLNSLKNKNITKKFNKKSHFFIKILFLIIFFKVLSNGFLLLYKDKTVKI